MKVSKQVEIYGLFVIICLGKNHFMNIKKRSVKPWRFDVYSPLTCTSCMLKPVCYLTISYVMLGFCICCCFCYGGFVVRLQLSSSLTAFIIPASCMTYYLVPSTLVFGYKVARWVFVILCLRILIFPSLSCFKLGCTTLFFFLPFSFLASRTRTMVVTHSFTVSGRFGGVFSFGGGATCSTMAHDRTSTFKGAWWSNCLEPCNFSV